MHSDAYTFRFAAIVTIVCSVLLAGAATILKPRQVENEKLDMKKNILVSAGIHSEQGAFSRSEITDLYKKYIRKFSINKAGLPVQETDAKGTNENDILSLYKYEKGGEIAAYIIPVSGKGLWSTIYGYIALGADCNTVEGITFYKHGETPGLGGEISKTWFADNFKGKQIFDDAGNLVSINVAKGKYTGNEPQHNVDGISGATLTGRGVSHFLKTELEKYKPFFANAQHHEGGNE